MDKVDQCHSKSQKDSTWPLPVTLLRVWYLSLGQIHALTGLELMLMNIWSDSGNKVQEIRGYVKFLVISSTEICERGFHGTSKSGFVDLQIFLKALTLFLEPCSLYMLPISCHGICPQANTTLPLSRSAVLLNRTELCHGKMSLSYHKNNWLRGACHLVIIISEGSRI